MKNGVLVHIRDDVRELTLPERVEELADLCRGGLNGREKDLLLLAVRMRWLYEYTVYKRSEDNLFDMYFDRYEDEEYGDEEEGEWDRERKEDEEWERAREERNRAKGEWGRVAGDWRDLINEAHYPRGRGVTIVVDIPYPTEGLGEDGKWVDRRRGREWRRAAKGRVREAKEAAREGRPLPEWALEVPLAQNRADRGKEAYLAHSETRALEETLERLEGWACEGRVKERLRDAITEELSRR